MATWQDRADAIRRRRVARGLRVDWPEQDSEQNAPRDDRQFDYGADIAEHPFKWWPGEPGGSLIQQLQPSDLGEPGGSLIQQLQPSDLGACAAPGCGQPVRKVSPLSSARPRYCSACMTDDGQPFDFRAVAERCQPPLTRSPAAARRVMALHFTTKLDGPDEVTRKRRAAAKKAAYTLRQKREVIALYSTLSPTKIAVRLCIPVGTVKAWISRYKDDPYYQKDAA